LEIDTVVERYYEIVGDLDADPDALARMLHPEIRLVEHPNAINPHGAARDRDGMLAAYAAGKRLLSAQSFELHEILSSGCRAAVRATWRGTVVADAGPLAGAELEAHVAALITVEDGLTRDHETFDCYEPLPG
jgi:hypothetical protein